MMLHNMVNKHLIKLQELDFKPFKSSLRVFVLRLDLIHPTVSGNKFFKLKHPLQQAMAQGFSNIATFGGAYSNHIVATACACHQLGLNSIGIIRGDELPTLSPTLVEAQQWGMKLHFVSRTAYKNKEEIKQHFPNTDKYYWINEGGYSSLGADGLFDVYEWIDSCFTDIVCAVGTGTMMAGLIKGAQPHQTITGISVLKGYANQLEDVKALLNEHEINKQYTLLSNFHFGGYAKFNPALIEWMNNFYLQHQVPTDIVYTAKMMKAVEQLVSDGHFKENSKIVMIHSGGLQGNLSLSNGTLLF